MATMALAPHFSVHAASQQLIDNVAPKPDYNTTEIGRIVKNFLSGRGIQLESTALDVEFFNECKEELISDYFCFASHPTQPTLTVSESWFEHYLGVGVTIATNGYGHLEDRSTIRYIAIYTALMTCFDDIFETNVEHISGFNERFMRGLPQEDLLLDAVAKVLLATPKHFGRLASNMIVTSTLDYFTSLSVDLQTRDMKFTEHLHAFAILCRNMSGIADAYAMFIFPRDIPFTVYIKCLPDLKTYINYMNDVMSFYKEDIAQETENLASILRQIHPSMTKYEVLQSLANDAAEADSRTRIVLAEYLPALKAYEHFRKGYVSFHVSSGRYRLDELFLSIGTRS